MFLHRNIDILYHFSYVFRGALYYYMADDWDDHMPDEQDSLSDFVKFATTFTLESL